MPGTALRKTGHDLFKDWGELWFRKKKLNFSLSYSATAKNHLKNIYSFIGDKPIIEIDAMDIDDLIIDYATKNPHTGKPTAKSTLKDMRNIAASVFDYACICEAISKNPAKGIEIPKHAPQEIRRALTKEEQKWIIHVPHRARLGALIMMFAGLRRGELIALTWQDIDFDNFRIYITKSVEKVENKYIIKNCTKNGSERCVEIPLDLAQEVQQAQRFARGKYICGKIDGTMHSPSSWRSMWSSYLCTINAFNTGSNKFNPNGTPKVIDNITPHMLRHTYATLLYMSGVDVLTASKLMGHADVETTLKIYTHLEEMTVEKSIDRFDTYISELVCA